METNRIGIKISLGVNNDDTEKNSFKLKPGNKTLFIKTQHFKKQKI